MRYTLSPKALRTAAEQIMQSMIDSIPDEPSYTFSGIFQERMTQLFQIDRIQQRNKAFAKRIAAVIIIVLLGFSMTVMLHPRVRAAVTKWFREYVADTYSYFFSEPVAYIPRDWELGWVPEGYEIIYNEATPTGRTILYQNICDEGIISFAYTRLDEQTPGLIFTFDDEYQVSTIQVRDQRCDLYISATGNEENALVWMEPDSGTMFTIMAYLQEKELVLLAENITEKIS